MAFRSSAVAFAASGNVTATPSGVQVGDYLGGWFLTDSASNTLTAPSGWTQRAAILWAGGGPDGGQQFYADKIATGTDSFQFSDTPNAASRTLICGAWSGRDTTNPRSTTPVTTKNTSSNTSAISATITGITATANDDIAIGLSTDQTLAAGRWTFSTITGYTEKQDGVAQDWTSGAGLQIQDNVGAGATGNFAVTITNSATGNAGYGAIVVAIKAAASTGAITGSADMAFGAGSSAITGAGALAGTAALLFGAGSSSVTGAAPIAGTADLTFTAGSSTLTGAGALAGSSGMVFGEGASVLQGAGALAGAAAMAFDASLSMAGDIMGLAAMQFGGQAALMGVGELLGVAPMVFGATAYISGGATPPSVVVDSSPAVLGGGGIQDHYWRDVEKRYAKKKREAKKKSKKAVELVEDLARQELALSEAIEQLQIELEAARIKNSEIYVELLKLKLEMVTAREAAIESDDEDEALFLGE